MDRQEAIDLILDHHQNPRHKHVMDDATFNAEGINSGCGDVVKMYVKMDGDDKITEVSFDGQGCTISQSAASLMTELAAGKRLDDVLMMDDETLINALGYEIVMNRTACATLALNVLKDAGRKYQAGA